MARRNLDIRRLSIAVTPDEDLLDLIGRGQGEPVEDAEFDRFALSVFAHQFERNTIYRRFCEAREATPRTIERWLDVPAVPTDAFKAAPLICGDDPATAEAVFRTSGTTGGPDTRGSHFMLTTRLYRASLIAGVRHALIPDVDVIRILSLVPPAALAPDSSLSFMVEEMISVHGSEDSAFFVDESGVSVEDFIGAAERATDERVPVLVVGTSFAFLHLLDVMADKGVQLRLPTGSRVMDTGGFKARTREVARDELYALIAARLGVAHPHIVNEYGMTEMSSQLYDGVVGAAPGPDAPRVHRGPGWLRSITVDPETLTPLREGEVGIVRHMDLANLHSVAALQTADLGRAVAGGLELLGRSPGAQPRGCSIAMDELLEVARRG